MITIKDFIKQEMSDSINKLYTPFQIEQLLIKYGRLVVDACANNASLEYGEDDSEYWINQDAILDTKKLIK